MVQLIQNLIGNSVKFRVQNEERPTTFLPNMGVKDWTFKVRDNGIEFPNTEYADKIFQMFQRLHSRDRFPGSRRGPGHRRRRSSNATGARLPVGG